MCGRNGLLALVTALVSSSHRNALHTIAQGITENKMKEEEAQAGVTEVDRHVDALWADFVDEGAQKAGAENLERLRQQEKVQVRTTRRGTLQLVALCVDVQVDGELQAKLAERKLKLLKKQVADVQRKLDAKRAEAKAAIEQARLQFESVLNAHEVRGETVGAPACMRCS